MIFPLFFLFLVLLSRLPLYSVLASFRTFAHKRQPTAHFFSKFFPCIFSQDSIVQIIDDTIRSQDFNSRTGFHRLYCRICWSHFGYLCNRPQSFYYIVRMAEFFSANQLNCFSLLVFYTIFLLQFYLEVGNLTTISDIMVLAINITYALINLVDSQ